MRVVPPAQYNAAIKLADEEKARAAKPIDAEVATGLAGFIRGEFETFKQHRNNGGAGWTERLLSLSAGLQRPVRRQQDSRRSSSSAGLKSTPD